MLEPCCQISPKRKKSNEHQHAYSCEEFTAFSNDSVQIKVKCNFKTDILSDWNQHKEACLYKGSLTTSKTNFAPKLIQALDNLHMIPATIHAMNKKMTSIETGDSVNGVTLLKNKVGVANCSIYSLESRGLFGKEVCHIVHHSARKNRTTESGCSKEYKSVTQDVIEVTDQERTNYISSNKVPLPP